MPHQWLEGNLPVSAKCTVCDKTCGSVLRLQDWRCLWCKAMVSVWKLMIFWHSLMLCYTFNGRQRWQSTVCTFSRCMLGAKTSSLLSVRWVSVKSPWFHPPPSTASTRTVSIQSERSLSINQSEHFCKNNSSEYFPKMTNQSKIRAISWKYPIRALRQK